MAETISLALGCRRVTWAVMTGTVLLSVAACTSSTSPAATPSSTRPAQSVTSASASPADVADRQAIATYLGMWQDFAAAGMTSDWQSTALGQHATGIALSNLSRGLYADHDNGLVTRGEPVLHPTVASMSPPDNPTTVVINDCGDSTHYLKYRASNGQPANDGPGGRQFIKATVQKQSDGSWKVTDFGVQAVGSC